MKKVLFATTALIATTGMAAAQGVTLSGSAEMGVFGGDRFDDGDDNDGDLQFHTDVDVTFTLSGATDAGLVFGASIDLDESDAQTLDLDAEVPDGATDEEILDAIEDGLGLEGNDAFADDSEDGGVAIFVSGELGTLTLGDTDGAFDFALREAAIGGSIADDHTEHAGYSGNSGLDGTFDGQIASYVYTFGDFSVAGSIEMDESPDDEDNIYGIGGTYRGDFGGFQLGVGLGYQTGDDSSGESKDIYGISADVEFAAGAGAVEIIFNYSELDGVGGADDHYAIAVGYTLDALTVGFNYGEFSAEDSDDDDADGYGLAVNYDLGGGAELQFGYGDGDGFDGEDEDSYSFGLSLAF